MDLVLIAAICPPRLIQLVPHKQARHAFGPLPLWLAE
jgi:hypothetical protein